MPDLAEIKARARRAIHGRLAVSAYLYPNDKAITPDDGKPVRVRWHNRIATAGALEEGYATIVDGIDRLLFNATELGDDGNDFGPIVLARNNIVVIPAYGNATFALDNLAPSDGPEDIVWTVARLKSLPPAIPVPPPPTPSDWNEVDW